MDRRIGEHLKIVSKGIDYDLLTEIYIGGDI